jgi:transcriptional regulator with XRE-family HTH domain
MMIGDRLRGLREAKKWSQGDIEKHSGLLRCYVSRVENGHTVPAIDTLEKWARALGIPMYQLFYDGEAPPKIHDEIRYLGMSSKRRGASGLADRYLSEMQECLTKLDRDDRALVLQLTKAILMTRRRGKT